MRARVKLFGRPSNGFYVKYALLVASAHIPYWFYSYDIVFRKAVLNYDIILAASLGASRVSLGLLSFFIVYVADIFYTQSTLFRLVDGLGFGDLRFIVNLSLPAYLSNWDWLSVFIGVVILSVQLVDLSRSRATTFPLLGLFFAVGLIILADTFNGTSRLRVSDVSLVNSNIAGSPIIGLASVLATPRHTRGQEHVIAAPVIPTGYSTAFLWGKEHPESAVVFVVVESMGLPRSARLLNWMAAHLESEKFMVRRAVRGFAGSTTKGEMMALCALEGHYEALESSNSAGCLPAHYLRLGWQTSGFHGFSGAMFDRRSWWPVIGLQSVHFADSETFRSAKRCGSVFNGICDEDVLRNAFTTATRPSTFTYVLTLNTHLPMVKVEMSGLLRNLCEREGVSITACQHLAGIGDVLERIARHVSSLKEATLVIVAGDHAPPFKRGEDRGAFDARFVPEFIMVPIKTTK